MFIKVWETEWTGKMTSASDGSWRVFENGKALKTENKMCARMQCDAIRCDNNKWK